MLWLTGPTVATANEMLEADVCCRPQLTWCDVANLSSVYSLPLCLHCCCCNNDYSLWVIIIFVCCLNCVLKYTRTMVDSKNIWHLDWLYKSLEYLKWSSNVPSLDEVWKLGLFCIKHLTISLKLLHLKIACVNGKMSFYLGGTFGANRALLNSER